MLDAGHRSCAVYAADGVALDSQPGLHSIAPLSLKDVDMYLYLNKRRDLVLVLANVLRG